MTQLAIGAVTIGQLALAPCAVAQVAAPERLTIGEAVAYGLNHSPALRMSEAEIRAAHAEAGIARSRRLPQLSATGFASRGNMPNILSAGPNADPRPLVLAPGEPFLDLNIMLMAPLYTGGYLSGLVLAAGAQADLAVAMAAEARAEVELRIREAFLLAQFSAELEKGQQARVVAAEALARIVAAQAEAGKGIEASIRRAEAELADARRELKMAENERKKSVLDLLAEMGAPLDRSVTLEGSLSFVPPRWSLDQSIAAALRSRGELVASRQRIAIATGRLSSTEGALRPQVYGYAMADVFAPRDAMGKGSGYSIGLTVSVPIFDAGMRRSEVHSARSMVERAELEAVRVKLQVEKEVRKAWLDIETAAEGFLTAEAALAAAQSAYDVAVVRLEAGKGVFVEQLDALATLSRARVNLAESLFMHELAIARLNRAIGGAERAPKVGTGK